MYEAWEARIKELTAYMQHRIDMAHSRSCSVAQGEGATTVHQGGVAGDAACPEEEEPVAEAMHARPQAVVHASAVAAQAKAAEVCSEPLSVGSTSSWHHCEEHCGAEIQRQEGTPVTLPRMRAGADPTRPTYAIVGG
jgi:hypothetical protein